MPGEIMLRTTLDGVPVNVGPIQLLGVALPATPVVLARGTMLLVDALNSTVPIKPQLVQDSDALIAATSTYVAVRGLTASRTLTLPAASAYPWGQPLYIADESGACSAALLINIVPSGSETISGLSLVQMVSPHQKFVFHSNGINLWTF